MAFQSTIYSTQALGKPGTVARLNPLDKVPVVAEANVVAGGFLFAGTNPETQVIGPSEATELKTAADIVGVAVFEKMQWNASGQPTLNINNGEELAKVRSGYVYVLSSTESVHGQKVFVNPGTGAISTAASAPSGTIDTGWVVETGNAAGQVCEIRK
ncbi:MAG: hypothetical protein II208_00305 [Alphaproteobacteria bacterium]|nr:hypothetical protein [Alphaproteobacteria bacterium]